MSKEQYLLEIESPETLKMSLLPLLINAGKKLQALLTCRVWLAGKTQICLVWSELCCGEDQELDSDRMTSSFYWFGGIDWSWRQRPIPWYNQANDGRLEWYSSVINSKRVLVLLMTSPGIPPVLLPLFLLFLTSLFRYFSSTTFIHCFCLYVPSSCLSFKAAHSHSPRLYTWAFHFGQSQNRLNCICTQSAAFIMHHISHNKSAALSRLRLCNRIFPHRKEMRSLKGSYAELHTHVCPSLLELCFIQLKLR